jgi:multiple sugar transport system permease protein
MHRPTTGGVIRDVFLFFVSIVWLFPTYLIVVNAITDANAYSGVPVLRPGPFGFFANIVNGLAGSEILLTFRNSLFYAIVSGIIAVVIAMIAAYVIVALRPKRPALWFWLIYAGSLLPLQAFSRPLYRASAETGLYDTWAGLLIVYVGLGVPFSMFVVRNVLSTMAPEVHEAATLDGAGWFRLLRHIYLPFALPVMGAAFIFQFVGVWNDLFIGITLSSSSDAQPVMATLASLKSVNSNIPIPELLAIAMVVSLPTVLIFVIFRRLFVNALRFG